MLGKLSERDAQRKLTQGVNQCLANKLQVLLGLPRSPILAGVGARFVMQLLHGLYLVSPDKECLVISEKVVLYQLLDHHGKPPERK